MKNDVNELDFVYNKILRALELVCPLYKEKLITEAYIVGSVAKGAAKEESDIDVYLINPLFELASDEIPPEWQPENIEKVVIKLKELGTKFKQVKLKNLTFWYQIYKNELFHLMIDYESESIRKAGEYIELTKEFCEVVKIE